MKHYLILLAIVSMDILAYEKTTYTYYQETYTPDTCSVVHLSRKSDRDFNRFEFYAKANFFGNRKNIMNGVISANGNNVTLLKPNLDSICDETQASLISKNKRTIVISCPNPSQGGMKIDLNSDGTLREINVSVGTKRYGCRNLILVDRESF